MKLGDAISTVATPVAKTLGLDCVDETTGQLKPDSPCAQRKNKLNEFGDEVWDFLWPTTNKRKTNESVYGNKKSTNRNRSKRSR